MNYFYYYYWKKHSTTNKAVANPVTSEVTTTKPALKLARTFLVFGKIIFVLKTLYASGCVVRFYNTGVVIRGRMIGSWYYSCKLITRGIDSWDRLHVLIK
jgi:hypothetical protein